MYAVDGAILRRLRLRYQQTNENTAREMKAKPPNTPPMIGPIRLPPEPGSGSGSVLEVGLAVGGVYEDCDVLIAVDNKGNTRYG